MKGKYGPIRKNNQGIYRGFRASLLLNKGVTLSRSQRRAWSWPSEDGVVGRRHQGCLRQEWDPEAGDQLHSEDPKTVKVTEVRKGVTLEMTVSRRRSWGLSSLKYHPKDFFFFWFFPVQRQVVEIYLFCFQERTFLGGKEDSGRPTRNSLPQFWWVCDAGGFPWDGGSGDGRMCCGGMSDWGQPLVV